MKWKAIPRGSNPRSRPPKPPLPTVNGIPAIKEDDLSGRQLRGLFLVLRRHLMREQFTPEDKKVLRRSLSAPVKQVILIANLKDDTLTCEAFTSSARICADKLGDYLTIVGSDPLLRKQEPLALCICGRIFAKARKGQKFCSSNCQFKVWASEHPNYRRDDKSLLVERKKLRG